MIAKVIAPFSCVSCVSWFLLIVSCSGLDGNRSRFAVLAEADEYAVLADMGCQATQLVPEHRSPKRYRIRGSALPIRRDGRLFVALGSAIVHSSSRFVRRQAFSR